MTIGVHIEPELEQQLDQLAKRMGQSRSACVRDAIAQYVQVRPSAGLELLDSMSSWRCSAG